MSNEQSKKRPASIDESTSSEPLAKKLTVSPAQNNNVDDVNEMVHGDNHQKPTDVKPIESRKLPDEILQKVYNETGGKLLIAGNVTWDLAGKTGMRNELTTFHRFTDEKVNKREHLFFFLCILLKKNLLSQYFFFQILVSNNCQ